MRYRALGARAQRQGHVHASAYSGATYGTRATLRGNVQQQSALEGNVKQLGAIEGRAAQCALREKCAAEGAHGAIVSGTTRGTRVC